MRISDWSSDVCSSDLLPALSRFRQKIVAFRNESTAVRCGEDELFARPPRRETHDLGFRLYVGQQPHRLAEPPAAGKLVGSQRVETAAVGRKQQLVGGLRVKGEGRAVPLLELASIGPIGRPPGPDGGCQYG